MSPDQSDVILVSEDTTRNIRQYQHAACHALWIVPHDGVERPAEAECPECIQTLPIVEEGRVA